MKRYNKIDKRTIINEVISFVVAAAVLTGLWLIGYFLVPTSNAMNIAAAIAVFSIFIMAIVNLIINRVYINKFNKMKVAEGHSYLMDQKSEIESDYRAAEKKVNKLIRRTMIYAVIILLVLAAAAFLMGAAEPKFTDDDGGATLAILPILCLIAQGIIAFLTRKSYTTAPEAENELTEKEFPTITALIKDCAKSTGINKPIRLYYTSAGIGVSEFKDTVQIFLNPIEVAFMTADELKSVMLHEFAHCIHLDTKKIAYYDDFNAKTEGVVSMFTIMGFLSYNISVTLFAMTLYNKISAREKEIAADKYVIDNGQAENYVNASAKAALYVMYAGYDWKETGYDAFEAETPMSDFVHRDYATFLKKLAEYKDKWFFTLYNELPQLVDSHPTFAMRMTACGVDSFDVSKTETDEKYIAEQDKFLSFADKVIHDNFDIEDYKEAREEEYLSRNELFEKVKNAGDSLDFANENEKLEIAQAYMNVDDEKALEILDNVLTSSTSSLAYFLKGMILSKAYDDECIKMFTESARSSAFFDESMDRLALYALKTGKQDVIDNYRKTIAEKMQDNIDDEISEERGMHFMHSPDKTDPVNIDVVNSVKEYWGDALIAVYLTEHVTDKGVTVKYLAIQVNQKKDFDFGKAHKDTVDMLFRHNKDNMKFCLFYGGKEFNAIKKTSGSEMFSVKK